MKSEKRKTENKRRESNGGQFRASRLPFSAEKFCSACGTKARRENAKFCLVCGKFLREEYQPLDTLRASYRLQGKSFLFENIKKEEVKNLFERDENSISQLAWACLVYSFVPYLGILFVPLTFFVGGYGYFVSRRDPRLGGRRLALICVALSFFVLAVQIFLWWLLYIIPELTGQI